MQPSLIWMIVGLVLLILELVHQGFFLLWIAAGALLTALLAAFVDTSWVQWLFFAFSSIVLLLATRPLARRLHAHVTVPSNVDSLIGKDAVVLDKIDPHANTGRVRIGSDEWRARSPMAIEVGEHVLIEGVEGTTLKVKPAAGPGAAADTL